jgi:hypothetical protein
MNEQQMNRGARHRSEGHAIERLSATTSDPEILALWEAGLARWGAAFIAFSSLQLPSLRSTNVLETFENIYVATLPSVDQLIDDHLEGMGWDHPLRQFRDTYDVTDDLLDWNRPAVLAAFKEFMEVIEEGGAVHVFLK